MANRDSLGQLKRIEGGSVEWHLPKGFLGEIMAIEPGLCNALAYTGNNRGQPTDNLPVISPSALQCRRPFGVFAANKCSESPASASVSQFKHSLSGRRQL